MNLFFLHHPINYLKDKPGEHTLVPLHESQLQHNITEGAEFFDDAIRMKDQPLTYTEADIAPGGPEDGTAKYKLNQKLKLS